MFDNIHSMGIGASSAIQESLTFEDLAFFETVMLIAETDTALAAKMKDLRQNSAEKAKLNEHVFTLSNALAWTHGKEDNDLVYVPGGLDQAEGVHEPATTEYQQRRIESGVEMFRKYGGLENMERLAKLDDFCPDKTEIQATVAWAKEQGVDTKDLEQFSKCCVKRSEVSAKIEKLKVDLDDKNSLNSLYMLDLQRIMNRRNEAIQQTSALEDGRHKLNEKLLEALR